MRARPHSRAPLGLVAALLLSACAGSSGGSSPAPGQNQVTPLSMSCVGGAGAIPNSQCQVLRVDVVGLAPLEVDVRITEPDPGTSYLGTAVLCSGGGGNEYFEELDGAVRLIGDLTAQGLRVVQRRWRAPWMSTSPSVREQSQRLAVLLPWIRANIHQGGLFCAIGNSGGSGEIGYALSTWDAESLLDRAVLCSGPSFSRLDYLCLPPSSLWAAQCPGIVPAGALTCGTPPCMQAEGAPLCSGVLPANATAVDLEEDSILHPSADLDHSGTLTYVLLGGEDCSVWVTQALLYAAAIQGPSLLSFVPGAPHTVTATPEGRAAIVQAVLGLQPATVASPELEFLRWSMTLVEPDEAGAWRHTVLRGGRDAR